MQNFFRLSIVFFNLSIFAQSTSLPVSISSFLDYLPQDKSASLVYQKKPSHPLSKLHIASPQSLQTALREVSLFQHANLKLIPNKSQIKDAFFSSGFFPFSIYVYNNKLWLMDSTVSGTFGQPIQRLENYTAEELIRAVSKLVATDHHTPHARYAQIQEEFAWYLYVLLGKKERFSVRLGSRNNHKTFSIPSSDLGGFYTHQKTIQKRIFQHHGLGLSPKIYFWIDEKTNVATLRINSFDMEQSAFHGVINSFFKKLNQTKIKKLILDLRFNTSLYISNAEILSSFLTFQKFINRYETFSITNLVPFESQLASINFKKTNSATSLNGMLSKSFIPSKSSGYTLNTHLKNNLSPRNINSRSPNNKIVESIPEDTFDPDKNHFKGKLIILSSLHTANAAFHAIRLIQKGNPRTKTVGLPPVNNYSKTSMGLILEYNIAKHLSLYLPLFGYTYANSTRNNKIKVDAPLLPLEDNNISLTDLEHKKGIDLLSIPEKEIELNSIF